MVPRRIQCALMVAITVLITGNGGEAWGGELDVTFVATPQEVVVEMLKMAQVTKNDVVYDLGCGDGRIVVTAAKMFGARGVGVDIDPVRIKESNENAMKAGVTDRVKFLEQDLFEMNLSEATVVTLYLLVELNVRLRPKLFRELKPGARVLSHEFGMEDWKPDHVKKVRNVKIYYQPTFPEAKDTYLYFWIIPAQVAGEWHWTLSGPRDTRDYGMHLIQKFQEFSGTLTSGGQERPIQKARLVGTQLSFTAKEMIGGKDATLDFRGRVDGDSIRGDVEVKGVGLGGKYAWTARRRF